MKQFFIIIFENICTIIDDTLKREKDGERRFSKTALTMFTAWIVVLYTFIDDYAKNGFKMDRFLVMVAIATGVKTADAISKKLNKNNNSQ